jgi:GTP-binding protein HflX
MDDHAALFDLEELKSLVSTFGGATIVRVIQRRSNPDPHTYIGSGKAEELADIIKEEKIDVVVLNDIVKPGQLFNLKQICWKSNNNIEVWDKVDLILYIFDKHAHTAEAKLQIELARMRHMGPRIYGMGYVLSRQAGGIGTRGIGETNTELMKRHWRNETKKVQEKLAKLAADRERKLEHRRKAGFKTVSIIGYTNAGKTTLFNRLTKKNKLAADILFATLDSSVGKLYLPQVKKEILVTDTIGFIQNLPPQLINAFKSTLMESIHADLLLHVIDITDPKKHEKIEIVHTILRNLHIDTKEQLYVFNKIDKYDGNIDDPKEMYGMYFPIFISAETNTNIDMLVSVIEKRLSQ